MNKRQLLIHNTYCELMIDKKPSRVYSVGRNKTIKKPVKGIKQTGESKAMLALKLASLF